MTVSTKGEPNYYGDFNLFNVSLTGFTHVFVTKRFVDRFGELFKIEAALVLLYERKRFNSNRSPLPSLLICDLGDREGIYPLLIPDLIIQSSPDHEDKS